VFYVVGWNQTVHVFLRNEQSPYIPISVLCNFPQDIFRPFLYSINFLWKNILRGTLKSNKPNLLSLEDGITSYGRLETI